jgi:hypothetical protein
MDRDRLVRSLHPTNSIELLLVERIVTAQWKLRRLNRLEQTMHSEELSRYREEWLDRLERYEAQLQADAEYRKSVQGYGFGQRPGKPDPEAEAQSHREWKELVNNERLSVDWIQANRVRQGGLEELERLGRLEQRLENSIHKNLRELDRMRASERRSRRSRLEQEDELPKLPCPYVGELGGLIQEAEQEADELGKKDQEQQARVLAKAAKTRAAYGSKPAAQKMQNEAKPGTPVASPGQTVACVSSSNPPLDGRRCAEQPCAIT